MRLPLPRAAALLTLLAACSSTPPPPPAADLKPPPPPTASLTAPPTAPPPPAAADAPPPAPIHEVHDTYFGTDITDPYRWMETDAPALSGWMKAQADHTRKALDKLPLRAELLARLRALDNAGSQAMALSRWGGKVFYLKTDPGKNTYKLYTRDSAKAPERLLVDLDALAEGDKHFSIDYYVPSRDGRLVAYGLSPSGSEMSVIHVLETKTGRALPDVIDRARYADISWQPDGRSFFYRRVRKLPPDTPEAERLIRQRVFLHVLGTDPEKDQPLFGQGVVPAIPVGDEAFPVVYSPVEGDYVFGVLYHGVRPELTLYIAPRSALAGDKTPWKKLVDPDGDEVTDYDVKGGDLYLLTHHQASRGKLLRVSLKKPDLAHATTVIPEGDAVLTGFALAKDALYAQLLDGGIGRILHVPYKGGEATKVPLPIEGAVSGLFGQPGQDGIIFRITSWTVSPEVCTYDPASAKVEDTGILSRSPIDFSAITSIEIKAKSLDGTPVPLSIVYRKDLVKDGSHPTLLEGYGAYGNIRAPAFDPMTLAWLERGGVFAACHPRGGGEYGEDWHRAGKLAKKTNTIQDFLGCAQALIDERFTAPAHLAGEGTSAGGILIGGAITARPDLFGAAVIRVGMTNALRFEQIPIGPFNTSEFGTVKTEDGFRMLLAIDAYHHVKSGAAYPAVLLTTGITDARVSPWQAAKMTARLQASTSSKKPVLLRVDYESGHGIGSTKAQMEAERADKYAFLLEALQVAP